MDDVYLMSFVEDAPTCHVVRRLLGYLAGKVNRRIILPDGFPSVMGGYGKLKARAKNWKRAAENGTWLLVVTDMDRAKTPNEIGKEWLGVECLGQLPGKMIFRVAVREIESWIMADREMFAKFLRIPESNVTLDPDVLMDPKAEVFRLVREKCTVTRFKKMLPVKNQAVGVDYNRLICEFVDGHWRVNLIIFSIIPTFADPIQTLAMLSRQ